MKNANSEKRLENQNREIGENLVTMNKKKISRTRSIRLKKIPECSFKAEKGEILIGAEFVSTFIC